MIWRAEKPIPFPEAVSIVDVVRFHAERQPDALAFRFLVTGESDGPTEEWTYAGLDLRARSIASHLLAAGAVPGERALLLYPAGLEFIAAFLGCLYSGVIAVPAYPHRTISRLEGIAQDSHCRYVLASSAFMKLNRALERDAPELGAAQWMSTSEWMNEPKQEWQPPALAGDTLALLQYTSGSTGQPKGVMVSHDNLLYNERLIQRAFGTDTTIHVVGWLPLYHDMGLIGNVLHPLFLGASCTLLSPLAFLQRPLRWLQAISTFGGTVSGGPNFAFDLCVRKLSSEEKLDLRSWRLAFCGSEPVRKETLDRFAAALAPFGFKQEAFFSCYGLAEATLFVSGTRPGSGPECRTYLAEALEQNRAVPASGAKTARALVSAGSSGSGQTVAIVDPQSRVKCPDGSIGEIWVSGPSVAQGYWGRSSEIGDTFKARLDSEEGRTFLRTGDLGFLTDGQLFITGRLKEVIILQGRNFYPQDIEFTAQSAHSAVQPGGCAAFSVDTGEEERLAVLVEVARQERDLHGVVEAVRQAVSEEFGIPVHMIALLPPKSILKTSSGKIRRFACRKSFLAGEMTVVSASALQEAGMPRPPYQAPRNELEWKLAKIWETTLGMEQIGIEDDFFQLGGHSLLATQAMAQISQDLGMELPLRSLFEAPTIAKFAEVVRQSAASPMQIGQGTSPIKRVSRSKMVSTVSSE